MNYFPVHLSDYKPKISLTQHSYDANAMDNRKDPYVHPLHQGEFRVILLYSGGWKTPLKCRLVTKMLGNVPQYQALSYAWGFPSVTRPILVDDIGMQITVNLERALMHLRREDADVVLWVDALVGTLQNIYPP